MFFYLKNRRDFWNPYYTFLNFYCNFIKSKQKYFFSFLIKICGRFSEMIKAIERKKIKTKISTVHLWCKHLKKYHIQFGIWLFINFNEFSCKDLIKVDFYVRDERKNIFRSKFFKFSIQFSMKYKNTNSQTICLDSWNAIYPRVKNVTVSKLTDRNINFVVITVLNIK